VAQKILIIEDDLAIASMFARFLNQAGYETSQAETLTEGLTRALTERPDLILTDLHLPDLIAVEAISALKKDPTTADIPVIVITADTAIEWRDRALEAGAVEYWIKPISVVDLIQLASKFCGPSRQNFERPDSK
jgi:two-component system, OmpR family, phosphate regulon response regulator PhoB